MTHPSLPLDGRDARLGQRERCGHADDEDQRDGDHLASARATPDEELRVGDEEDRRHRERGEDEDVQRSLA